jgi:hypothetical protein
MDDTRFHEVQRSHRSIENDLAVEGLEFGWDRAGTEALSFAWHVRRRAEQLGLDRDEAMIAGFAALDVGEVVRRSERREWWHDAETYIEGEGIFSRN